MNKYPQALEGIKNPLTTLLFLLYPIYDGKAQFIIQTDASTTTISRILYQESGSNKWIIPYNSHVLTDTKTWCSTIQCKCLAIVNGF
uniref:Reverse transcriptase/retrotransposon-derived protein RNase H-like domain-containing protein n=1 Tax=Romanomermis culicivorax TaxID=13658 RepID=A0A915HUQ1_ROMCU